MTAPAKPISVRPWLWAGVALTLLKLWLTREQSLHAIGSAFHDDRLFVELAGHLLNGEWLGPYHQLTLAKGPFYSIFLAANFRLGLPVGLTQQLVYAVACAVCVHALRPWLRHGAAALAAYALLLWNPMSYEGANLTRLVRQNIATPLALLVVAAMLGLYARRRERFRRQMPWAVLAGAALGCFWLTREEAVWLLPAVGILGLAYLWELPRAWREHASASLRTVGLALLAAAVPVGAVCALNAHYYGWFGTVEFRAPAFNDAYGALLRVQVGPRIPYVPITRQMREAIYAVSPAFAELRLHFEGEVGGRWVDRESFPAAERQIRGGWVMWALRDTVVAAGHGHSAGEALAFYRRMADEINAACDRGLLPALPRRSGFFPPITPEFTRSLQPDGWRFARYFFQFDAFTARTSDSEGDYAELKIFRDLTRDRISPAPRSPVPPTPGQDRINELKGAALESIGRGMSALLFWLVPLAVLALFARALECIHDRRVTFPFVLAVAAILACTADLAINVLVHVTSFPTMNPLAMASAYPILLVFVIAISVDAADAWILRRASTSTGAPTPPPASSSERPARVGRALWIGGAALIVFAARLAEINQHGGDVPFNDQWKIEAADIIAPWLNGTLTPSAFFAHHFEHVPAWSRLLVWLQVVLTGRWDPLMQMTVNAVLHASFVAWVVRWVRDALPWRSAVAITALVVGCGVLPFDWENIAWGFQSAFPLALVFLFLHAHGSFAHAPGTKPWWWAQAAAVAGLFTLASMWLAPLAVVAVWLWTTPRGPRLRLIPLLAAAVGMGMLLIIRITAPPEIGFAQVAGTRLHFVHAWLDLLGWPAGWPGALLVLQTPLFVFALQMRGRRDASAFDSTVLALGAWAVAQAAALAFARGSEYSGYVSRYGELLAVGLLVNAIALLRLFPLARTWRPSLSALAACWLLAAGVGLKEITTTGHTRYFHDVSAERALIRRDAVQAYLFHHDRHQLDLPATKGILYQGTDEVTRLLDQPKFRALLPTSVDPANPPDRPGRVVRAVQRRWRPLGAVALGALLAGFAWGGARAGRSTALPPLESHPDRLRPWLVAALGTGALAALFGWPAPFTLDPAVRWRTLVSPATAVREMEFTFVGPAPFANYRIAGAAPLASPELRTFFYGTAPDGPALTGEVWSNPFPLTSPWLVVPFAGYPTNAGNAIRLRIENDAGATLEEIACPGPTPRDIAFWSVDVRRHLGQRARLVLYDGRTDDAGWVAVAPPIAATDAGLAERLARQLPLERMSATHSVLAWIAIACGAWLALVGGIRLGKNVR